MPYPYSKYRDGADTEAHVCDFLTTWEVNHVAQRLSTAAEEKFVLSMSWYAQNEPKTFDSFEQLASKFTQLFHRQIPQKNLISQFYAAYQVLA